MDKRKYLGSREYFMTDGNSFIASIYQKSNNRGISIRPVYGQMEIYVSSKVSFKMMDEFVTQSYVRFKDHIFNRPFMKENIYIYMLGKKKYFTSDIRLKNDPDYFYMPLNAKDPLVRYKKMFLDYLKVRVVQQGMMMGVDLSSYIIRTGLFLTYYGVCFPVKKQFKFDYRLFAYEPKVMDSIIIHEIAHTFETHHNDRFYQIVNAYCPNYDKRIHEIECGKFEGEMDYDVF